MYKHFFKRLLDFVISGVAILILLPFFLIFTPIVAIAMGGNPFFIQKRPGKNGKIFGIIKYRTMNNKKDNKGNLLPDSERLTRFGKLLRMLSIDELPELLNIFLGQMSIVGPRPLLTSYIDLYNEEQMRRHDVRPGLTGLAQISGRNAISWEQKFQKDIEYVDNCSLFLDIKIIIQTVKKVLSREGISQEGQATMDIFCDHTVDKKLIIKLYKYKDQAEKFVKRYEKYTNIEFIICDSYEETITDSDIIVSGITYADKDFCDDSCFKEGCLVVPIHTLGFQNCDLFFDKVYGDDYDHICGFKYFDEFRNFNEVSEVVTSVAKGRENDKERILVYNIGIALHDVYYSYKIYEKTL